MRKVAWESAGVADRLSNRNRPTILLAASVWWPLSARLAIRFVEHGCRVIAVCPKGHFLRCVDGLEAIYPYRSLSSLASLKEAIRRSSPDLIIPCDDRVVWQLHELHAAIPELRSLIETSIGAASQFEVVSHRELLLATAHALGIRTPATKRVASEEEIRKWFATGEAVAVLKLDGTWGGEGVIVARSEQEAIDAFRRLSRPLSTGTALKRLSIDRDPLALWSWNRRVRPIIEIQQFIAGQPANSMLACWRGEVLSMNSVEVLGSQGATGAAFLVRRIKHEEMARAAFLLARRLQLTGFCGLDFVLDDATGQLYFIEMNPRCTQLGHLPFSEGHDLVSALCTRLTGETYVDTRSPLEDRAVAFFPQASQWVAKNSTRGVYNDVPVERPELVRELMRPSWPERQWISRVYHWFRPRRKADSVEYRSSVVADGRK